MGKVRKINLDGQTLQIDDDNALQLPEGVVPQDGDILIYSEADDAFIYGRQSAQITVDDELSETSTNPVQNKVITTQLELKKKVICLYARFDTSTGAIKIAATIDGESNQGVAQDSVDIAFMCFATYYDQLEDDLEISNISGYETIVPNSDQEVSLTQNFGSFPTERKVLLFVSDQVTEHQIVKLATPVINIPQGQITTNLIQVSAGNGPVYSNQIVFTPTVALGANIGVRLRIQEDGYTDVIRDIVLPAGSTVYNQNIGSSGQYRVVSCAITNNSQIAPCTLNTSMLSVAGRLPLCNFMVAILYNGGDYYDLEISVANVPSLDVSLIQGMQIVFSKGGGQYGTDEFIATFSNDAYVDSGFVKQRFTCRRANSSSYNVDIKYNANSRNDNMQLVYYTTPATITIPPYNS